MAKELSACEMKMVRLQDFDSSLGVGNRNSKRKKKGFDAVAAKG